MGYNVNDRELKTRVAHIGCRNQKGVFKALMFWCGWFHVTYRDFYRAGFKSTPIKNDKINCDD